MEQMLVKGIYNVDTISKGNTKAWVKLKSIMEQRESKEPLLFDFKGIEVQQPWCTHEFQMLMQDKRVFLRLWGSEDTVKSINLMCTLCDNDPTARAYNEDIVVERKLTNEEISILNMANDLQNYFEAVGNVATFNVYRRLDQIGMPKTVSYIEAAIEKYIKSNPNIKEIVLNSENISIAVSVIKLLTELVDRVGLHGVKLTIHSQDTVVMNKLSMHKSIGSKSYSDDDKLNNIKSKLYPGKVGMLIKYRVTKGKDEFGRMGSGTPVICRVAIFNKLSRVDGKVYLNFTWFDGNTFYTGIHWQLEHDGEPLSGLSKDVVSIPIEEFGMYDDFLGSKYHFIAPIQKDTKHSITMYDLDGEGKTVRNILTIPERIKVVFDDWGIKYDTSGMDAYIEETRRVLGL